ncbi:glycosyltransferase family 61 protein [Candidatus Actinomarina sp.]|nr:glycosyltransferase family 61 protein [Candidatus Actinomarina sp.]
MIRFYKRTKGKRITRNYPLNVKDKEKFFFDNEIEKFIPGTFLVGIKNATIAGYNIRIFKNFTVFQDHTYFYKLTFIQRLKNVLKGFLDIAKKKDKIYVEKAIWIIDTGSNNYFHWVADCLTRLVYAKSFLEGHKVLLPIKFKNLPYVEESLSVLNIDILYYEENDQIKVKELLLPSRNAPTGNYSESILALRTSLLGSKISNQLNEGKIFISRRKAGKRDFINEQKVYGLLQKFGFKKIYCEDLGFIQQIKTFQNCTELVSIHGAGMVNQMFMPSSSKIIEIRTENNSSDNAFFSLANFFNHKYFYLNSKYISTNNMTNLYDISTSELEKLLKTYF